ncbi:hemK methyltransferase family member 2 [Pelomyxa schiedti]|nr:hemK methyltransferase family member 2 [Pelomyxa schiedti]
MAQSGVGGSAPRVDIGDLVGADFVDGAVYEPADDTFLLVDSISDDWDNFAAAQVNNSSIFGLEVGCGSGYVITHIGLLHRARNCATPLALFATDVNPLAGERCIKTSTINHVNVEVVVTDLVSGLLPRLKSGGGVDLLVFNPPYVPTPPEEIQHGGIYSAWAGGKDGREVLDRLLPVVNELLSSTGFFYVVVLQENNPRQLMLLMHKKGFAVKVVGKKRSGEEQLYILRFYRKNH